MIGVDAVDECMKLKRDGSWNNLILSSDGKGVSCGVHIGTFAGVCWFDPKSCDRDRPEVDGVTLSQSSTLPTNSFACKILLPDLFGGFTLCILVVVHRIPLAVHLVHDAGPADGVVSRRV